MPKPKKEMRVVLSPSFFQGRDVKVVLFFTITIIFSVAKLSGVAKTLHQADFFSEKILPGHLWPSDFRYSPLSLRIRW